MRLFGRRRKRSVPAQVAIIDGGLTASSPHEATFAALFEQVHERALRRFERIIGYDLAAEAFQDAALELNRKWSDLLPEGKTAAAFMKAIEFRIRDRIEERRNDPGTTLDEDVEQALLENDELDLPDVAIAYEGVELNAIVDRAVNELPEQSRQTWVLLREGYSQRHIADILRLDETTVSRHVARARKHLQQALRRAGYQISRSTARALIPRQSGEATNV